MTGDQLKAFIKRAGLTNKETARLIGVGERTMRTYLSQDEVPKIVELAVLKTLDGIKTK